MKGRVINALAGRSAIVTGSSSGIGREIALLLARQGVNVVINARGSGDTGIAVLDDVVARIRADGGTAIAVPGAVNDPLVAQALVERCVEAFGSVDILINNAAICTLDPVDRCDAAHWREMIDINLNGVFYTCNAALPHMKRQRWGRLLTASSLAGLGVIGGSSYAASKAALLGLSRAMAADYGPYGITSNAYLPEARTAMGATDDAETFKAMRRHWHDRGYETAQESAYRLGTGGPEGIAPWIAYLCTDDAAYLNGQAFAVEGRRIAMIAWPDETRALYRDIETHGPWSLEELQTMAPLAFPVANRWPRRSAEDLAHWEAL